MHAEEEEVIWSRDIITAIWCANETSDICFFLDWVDERCVFMPIYVRYESIWPDGWAMRNMIFDKHFSFILFLWGYFLLSNVDIWEEPLKPIIKERASEKEGERETVLHFLRDVPALILRKMWRKLERLKWLLVEKNECKAFTPKIGLKADCNTIGLLSVLHYIKSN